MQIIRRKLKYRSYNFNDYYDPKLKESRIKNLIDKANKKEIKFKIIRADIDNFESLKEIFNKYNFDYVVNLAAQAGVRFSINNPESYIRSNLVGFGNILEICRIYKSSI